MDRSDLTGRLVKLRAEIAEIQSQIVEYRANRHHSHIEEKEHSDREVRIREIRAELEGMMETKIRRR